MCGRFYIEDAFDWADVLRLMGAQNRRLPEAAKRSGEVNPTDAALVLAPSKDLSPGAFAMRWGYRLPDGHLVINARSETARSRPLFADGMRRRRCAVPVSGYIEWDRSGTTRRKYKVDGGTAEPLFLAGLYRPAEKGAEFTVLTRSPSDAVAALHAEGYTVVAVEQTVHSVKLGAFRREPGRKYALVFGNEVSGVRQDVVDACDFSLEIPQYGTKHSLNVSVSVGVVLWEMVRNNGSE